MGSLFPNLSVTIYDILATQMLPRPEWSSVFNSLFMTCVIARAVLVPTESAVCVPSTNTAYRAVLRNRATSRTHTIRMNPVLIGSRPLTNLDSS